MGRTIKYALGGALILLACWAEGVALGYLFAPLFEWWRLAVMAVVIATGGMVIGVAIMPQQKGTD